MRGLMDQSYSQGKIGFHCSFIAFVVKLMGFFKCFIVFVCLEVHVSEYMWRPDVLVHLCVAYMWRSVSFWCWSPGSIHLSFSFSFFPFPSSFSSFVPLFCFVFALFWWDTPTTTFQEAENSPTKPDWLASKFQESSYLCPSPTPQFWDYKLLGYYHMWVFNVCSVNLTCVCMLIRQVPYERDYLPRSLFDKEA